MVKSAELASPARSRFLNRGLNPACLRREIPERQKSEYSPAQIEQAEIVHVTVDCQAPYEAG